MLPPPPVLAPPDGATVALVVTWGAGGVVGVGAGVGVWVQVGFGDGVHPDDDGVQSDDGVHCVVHVGAGVGDDV